jgi:hypothetical protein
MHARPDVVVDQELLETHETGIGATVRFVHKSWGDFLVWAEELNNRVHDGILEIGRLQVLTYEVSTKESPSHRHSSRVLIVSIIGRLLHSNIRPVNCRLVDGGAFGKTSAGHRYRNVLEKDEGFVLEPQRIVSEDRRVETFDPDTLAFQTVGEKILKIANVSSVLIDVMTDQESQSGNYPLFTHVSPFILFEVGSRYLEEALLRPELQEYAHWFRPRWNNLFLWRHDVVSLRHRRITQL